MNQVSSAPWLFLGSVWGVIVYWFARDFAVDSRFILSSIVMMGFMFVVDMLMGLWREVKL